MSLNGLWILEFESECWWVLGWLSSVWLKYKGASDMAKEWIFSSWVCASAWLAHHVVRLVKWIVVPCLCVWLHLDHFRQDAKSIASVIVNWQFFILFNLACLLFKALSWIDINHNLVLSHWIMEAISLWDLLRNGLRPSIIAELFHSGFRYILRILISKVVLIPQLHRLAIHSVKTILRSFLGRKNILWGWQLAILDWNCKVLVQMALRSIEDWSVVVDAILLYSIEVNWRSLFLVRSLGGRSTEFAVMAGEDWLKLIEIFIDGLILYWSCLLTLFSNIFKGSITKLLHLKAENHTSKAKSILVLWHSKISLIISTLFNFFSILVGDDNLVSIIPCKRFFWLWSPHLNIKIIFASLWRN